MQSSPRYELRVQGSIGTPEGTVRGATDGVAIADDGYLCSVGSGYAMHFETPQAAMEYLSNCKIPGKDQFEIVECYCGKPVTARK